MLLIIVNQPLPPVSERCPGGHPGLDRAPSPRTFEISNYTDLSNYRYIEIPLYRITMIRYIDISENPYVYRNDISEIGKYMCHLCHQPLGGVPESIWVSTELHLHIYTLNIRYIEKPMYRHDTYRKSVYRNDIHIENSIHNRTSKNSVRFSALYSTCSTRCL